MPDLSIWFCFYVKAALSPWCIQWVQGLGDREIDFDRLVTLDNIVPFLVTDPVVMDVSDFIKKLESDNQKDVETSFWS